MSYSTRFDDALTLAHDLHRDQVRKGSGVPYITHLLGVASLVGENGGTEDQVIAALLHDAIEDCIDVRPDIRTEIGDKFGDEVLAIVEACTDSDTIPKPPWRARKVEYLERLARKPAGSPALIVSKADKLHNLRSIVRDYRVVGDELWSRFKGGRDGTIWYYRELSAIFARLAPGPMQRELTELVVTIQRLVDE